MKRFSFLFLLAFFAPTAAYAVPAGERLEGFFNNIQTMQADFQQTLVDEQGNVVQEASGTFALQRPGKFRWDYAMPFEQLIVADGKKVWIYDVELEQVTVKPLQAALGSTPAALLSGSQPLEDNFTITERGTQDGLQWIELQPKAEATDSSFESIRMAFDSGDLRVMQLLDSFGQTTYMRFSDLQSNPDIDPSLFEFIPPEGVDVIGETD